MTIASAEANLWQAIFSDETGRDDETAIQEAIDHLKQAVREELTRPGERSPELVAAETLLRTPSKRMTSTERLLLAAHLDALRARLAQAEEMRDDLAKAAAAYKLKYEASLDGVFKRMCDKSAAEEKLAQADAELAAATKMHNETASRLAQSEADLATVEKAHTATADKLRQAYSDGADLKIRCDLSEAENAELRALCGRGGERLQRKGPRVDRHRRRSRAAARRAGK